MLSLTRISRIYPSDQTHEPPPAYRGPGGFSLACLDGESAALAALAVTMGLADLDARVDERLK